MNSAFSVSQINPISQSSPRLKSSSGLALVPLFLSFTCTQPITQMPFTVIHGSGFSKSSIQNYTVPALSFTK
jgi:hypothetical protein